MKYVFEANFVTDGDYAIRIDNFQPKYQEYIHYDDEIETYNILFETPNIYDMQEFLEQLMVSFDVSWTHHYLLTDLYEVTNDCHEYLWNEEQTIVQRFLHGNYSGTELFLTKRGFEK